MNSRLSLLLVLLVFGLSACGKNDAPTAMPAQSQPQPVAARTQEMALQKVPVVIESVGRTEGAREVEVRARVSGILEKQLFAEGQPVRAGAVLVRIDPAPFELALAQARAALAQERSRNEQARREAERLKGLIAAKAISQREYDDAGTTLKSSAATLDAAENRVREAELNLSYTALVAPISGVTGRVQRSEGNLLTVNTESALITSIIQTDPVWVRFALSDAEFEQLKAARGATGVRLKLPDGKPYARPGRLNFTASTVDTRLGTVQMRAEFANPAMDILPGQFVRVELSIGTREAFLLPQTAVLQGDRGRFVWTVGEDGKAAARPVQVGNWIGNDWVILSGLKPGDKVVLDNLLRVRPGTQIQPPAAPASAAAPAVTPAAAPAPADSNKK